MLVISKFLFKVFFAFFNNLANKTQLNNSKQGIEIFFKGATFAFPHNKFTKIQFLVVTRVWHNAEYVFIELPRKPWSSICKTFSWTLWNKYFGTINLHKLFKSFNDLNHNFSNFSSKIVAYKVISWQIIYRTVEIGRGLGGCSSPPRRFLLNSIFDELQKTVSKWKIPENHKTSWNSSKFLDFVTLLLTSKPEMVFYQ